MSVQRTTEAVTVWLTASTTTEVSHVHVMLDTPEMDSAVQVKTRIQFLYLLLTVFAVLTSEIANHRMYWNRKLYKCSLQAR